MASEFAPPGSGHQPFMYAGNVCGNEECPEESREEEMTQALTQEHELEVYVHMPQTNEQVCLSGAYLSRVTTSSLSRVTRECMCGMRTTSLYNRCCLSMP